MVILGVNAFHGDAAAALLIDGRLVAAAEEERFRRIKHWAGFPAQAIKYCLREAQMNLADVDYVAVNSAPGVQWPRKLGYIARTWPSPRWLLARVANAGNKIGVAERLNRIGAGGVFQGSVRRIEHHRAHLASAYFLAPFSEAVAVSVDGFGDFASAAWGIGRGNALAVQDRVYFPHSLGIFYQAITQYLGFPHYGDEYKVMGLASYGKARQLDAMRRLVQCHADGKYTLALEYFRHHRERIDYRWEEGCPRVGRLFSAALEDLLGPCRQPDEEIEPRHRDIACSAQTIYEYALFHLLNSLYRCYPIAALTLAGGCAMNSVANGKITKFTPFRELFIQPAAGDAGGALGAAYAALYDLAPPPTRAVLTHAYWGPQFTEADIAEALGSRRSEWHARGCRAMRIDRIADLCQDIAGAIAAGAVVGWFQGRMEWGPRALGNRSILADPRRTDMQEMLNRKIKRREAFRPFAPTVLREAVADWFETDVDEPFMLRVIPIRADRRALIPAVTHSDGTGRLQTLRYIDNPLFYQLIKAFYAITQVPMLLNTSFNESEPIVFQPAEALDCFLRTEMDVLVLAQWVIRKA
ncbi:MAG: carbamoyltransferase C-terminal domain-containing protein [Gammaproteobacteria bacterium]